jgi:hypothetical protein
MPVKNRMVIERFKQKTGKEVSERTVRRVRDYKHLDELVGPSISEVPDWLVKETQQIWLRQRAAAHLSPEVMGKIARGEVVLDEIDGRIRLRQVVPIGTIETVPGPAPRPRLRTDTFFDLGKVQPIPGGGLHAVAKVRRRFPSGVLSYYDEYATVPWCRMRIPRWEWLRLEALRWRRHLARRAGDYQAACFDLWPGAKIGAAAVMDPCHFTPTGLRVRLDGVLHQPLRPLRTRQRRIATAAFWAFAHRGGAISIIPWGRHTLPDTIVHGPHQTWRWMGLPVYIPLAVNEVENRTVRWLDQLFEMHVRERLVGAPVVGVP